MSLKIAAASRLNGAKIRPQKNWSCEKLAPSPNSGSKIREPSHRQLIRKPEKKIISLVCVFSNARYITKSVVGTYNTSTVIESMVATK